MPSQGIWLRAVVIATVISRTRSGTQKGRILSNMNDGMGGDGNPGSM